MEWVETTGKTVAEAKETGPRSARCRRRRRRVRDPRGATQRPVRSDPRRGPGAGADPPDRGAPEAGRRTRGRNDRSAIARPTSTAPRDDRTEPRADIAGPSDVAAGSPTARRAAGVDGEPRSSAERTRPPRANDQPRGPQDDGSGDRSDGSEAPQDPPVDPAAVGAAAVAFVEGLVDAFGLPGTTELASRRGSEFEVSRRRRRSRPVDRPRRPHARRRPGPRPGRRPTPAR